MAYSETRIVIGGLACICSYLYSRFYKR